MNKYNVVALVAKKLRAAMATYPDQSLRTQAGVAKKTKGVVTQRAVGDLLNPEKRAKSKSGKDPGPTLVKVAAVAAAFEQEVWEFLQPPIDSLPPSKREAEARRRFNKARADLTDYYETLDPDLVSRSAE